MNSLKWHDSCILQTLLACQLKNDKSYSYPSQTTILRLLKIHYGITICRRTLNYRLRYLEDNNFIKRVRRIKAGPGGTIIFRSTMYWLGRAAYKLFSKTASLLSRAKFKVRKWWEKEKPAPVSRPEPVEEVWTPEQRQANLLRLRQLRLALR